MSGDYVGDKSKHILNLPHGEQCSINNKPFFIIMVEEKQDHKKQLSCGTKNLLEIFR